MTFQEYFHQANRFFIENKNDQRYGQSLMNYLRKISPNAYNGVMFADNIDPFYDDNLVPEFLNYLSNNWTELTRPANS